MATQTPQRPVALHRTIPAPLPQRPERTLSAVPQLFFWLAAGCLMFAPVLGTVIVDPLVGSHPLDLGLIALVIPAPIVAASAIILGFIACPGRVVSRRLQTSIDISLSTLLAGVVGTALALLLAVIPGSINSLGAIAVTIAYIGLTGYMVACIGTLFLNRSVDKG